jgi:hypothetical protein
LNDQPVYSIDEFEVESRYIETLIWEALAIERDSKILLCGYGPNGEYAKRAIESGANVTVIEHRIEVINAHAKLDAKLLRGSTSVIPAKDNTYDLAISFHYLHEIDPFFHSQVLSELGRVARRIAVIEPAPPADPLGKRIALIYSQAKRELGQFEYYQPLEYWKKILQGVKADVAQNVFAFAKVPPRHYLRDTIKLMLDAIEQEDAPLEYMDELRTIAHRSDAQMLPPPRYVLVGSAAGEQVVPSFSKRPEVYVPPGTHQIVAKVKKARAKTKAESPKEITAEAGYEFPPIQAPAEQKQLPTPPETITAGEPHPQPLPPVAPPPRQGEDPPPSLGFGLAGLAPEPPPLFGVAPPTQPPPPAAGSPFGVPFAVPSTDNSFGVPPEGVPPTTSWLWEPPENPEGAEGEEKPPDA